MSTDQSFQTRCPITGSLLIGWHTSSQDSCQKMVAHFVFSTHLFGSLVSVRNQNDSSRELQYGRPPRKWNTLSHELIRTKNYKHSKQISIDSRLETKTILVARNFSRPNAWISKTHKQQPTVIVSFPSEFARVAMKSWQTQRLHQPLQNHSTNPAVYPPDPRITKILIKNRWIRHQNDSSPTTHYGDRVVTSQIQKSNWWHPSSHSNTRISTIQKTAWVVSRPTYTRFAWTRSRS